MSRPSHTDKKHNRKRTFYLKFIIFILLSFSHFFYLLRFRFCIRSVWIHPNVYFTLNFLINLYCAMPPNVPWILIAQLVRIPAVYSMNHRPYFWKQFIARSGREGGARAMRSSPFGSMSFMQFSISFLPNIRLAPLCGFGASSAKFWIRHCKLWNIGHLHLQKVGYYRIYVHKLPEMFLDEITN